MVFSIFIIFIGIVMVFALVRPMSKQIGWLRRVGRAQRSAGGGGVPGGEVAVHGTAERSGDLLTGPLTDDPCIFWQLEVQELRQHGRGSSWVTILNQCSTQPFLLNDGLVIFQVQPAGSERQMRRDYAAVPGFWSGLDDSTRWRLESLGVETKALLGFNKQLRAYESVVVPGDRVCAVGEVDYRGGAPVLYSRPNMPLLLADGTLDSLTAQLRRKLMQLILWFVLAIGFFAVIVAVMGVPF